jgi:hypothetical protein
MMYCSIVSCPNLYDLDQVDWYKPSIPYVYHEH